MGRRRNRSRSNESTNSSKAVNKEDKTAMSATSESSGTEDKDQKPTKTNDVAWYDRDPQLTKDGASIPWNKPFGAQFDMRQIGPYQRTGASSFSIPGLCIERLKMSFGDSTDIKSPLNVAANALYTEVRHKLSGRKNYDVPDLMLYVEAFSNIYAFLIWTIRAYNMAFMYSQRNWYFGKTILEAEGWDVKNLVENLANFRYQINVMINKIASFCLPSDIYEFKRRVFLFNNIYIENPYGNIKDQMYMFSPDGFYRFELDQVVNPGAGKLKYFKIPRSQNTSTISDIFDHFMEYITGDEDFGLMSGDILKVYEGNIIGLSQIPEEGGILPVYDAYVLSQFKNATPCRIIRGDYNTDAPTVTYMGKQYTLGDVVQTSDGILRSIEAVSWDATVTSLGHDLAEVTADANKIVISVENPNPDVGDTLEATRLIVANDGSFSDSGTLYIKVSTGTEICTDVSFHYLNADKSLGHLPGNIGSNVFIIMDTDTNAAVDLGYLMRVVSSFKYGPTMYYALVKNIGAGEFDVVQFDLISNMENTTEITPETMRRIHEIALLSLFYVPGVAKLIS